MKYLVFPVKVDVEKKAVKSREETNTCCEVEATNYEEAHTNGSNHVPLFEGEQLAVVRIG